MSTGTRGRRASKVDREAATKHTTVEFVGKNADEQVVTGVVMSPMSVDRQGDYETPETIESFADGFETFYDSDYADGGIMHAAWPSEWMDLAYNGIVGRDDLPEDVADMDLEDGKWVQTWDINDDGLWSLIDDEIFQGFSIGARDVEWRGPLEQDELPEGVGVPDEYDEDDPVYELVSGEVREVSTVDTPAVPEALVLSKDDAEKALDEYLGDRAGFLEEVQQRGHSEEDAERMWDVMSRAAEVDGSESPGKESFFSRIGKAAWSAVAGDGDKPDDAAGAETQTRPDTAKEGRTLSRANRDSAKAAVDANLDLLEDAGVDHGMTRFTDKEGDPFDLTEHAARSWGGTDDDTDDEDEDEDDTETMSDDTTDDTNEKVLEAVKSLQEDVDELKSDDADGGDDAADADKDTNDDDLTEAVETLTDEVTSLKETAQANSEAIDTIGKQAGFSTQLDGEGGDGGEAGDEGGLDDLAKVLS